MILELLRNQATPEHALAQICILVELLFETGRGQTEVEALVRQTCALAAPFPAAQAAPMPADE